MTERLLPARLRARLAPDHRLLVVPSGPLYMLPWAALRFAERWLCEHTEIEVLPGLAYVTDAEPRPRKRAALVVACDHFGERAPALPNTLASATLLAETWRGPVTQLTGPAATRAALEAHNVAGELRRYGLIHIAAHAQLGGVDGLLAHVKLADHDLGLDAVLRLNLDRPLVVLAACEGGAGAVLPGDEILGLSRALIAAGATAVLASLWPVYDKGVLALLEPFYTALAAGTDAVTALAWAQRTLLSCDGNDPIHALVASPMVWGGFTVTSGGGGR